MGHNRIKLEGMCDLEDQSKAAKTVLLDWNVTDNTKYMYLVNIFTKPMDIKVIWLSNSTVTTITTYSDSIIDIVNSSVSNFIDGFLKILQTTECLFITKECKYYTNPMESEKR